MVERISKSELRALFCSRLKLARARNQMTQSALAEACDLTVDMISRIERGKSFPSFNALARMVEVLGVHPSYLFGGPDQSTELEMPPARRALHRRVDALSLADLERVNSAIDLIVR